MIVESPKKVSDKMTIFRRERRIISHRSFGACCWRSAAAQQQKAKAMLIVAHVKLVDGCYVANVDQ